jgi:general nucleoside transport system ATP-binding protein
MATVASTVPARLELRGIRKSYAGIVANDGIDLKVMPGEIHALLGENGAGKSTLMKIVYGVVKPMLERFAGKAIRSRSPIPRKPGVSESAWSSSISHFSRR